MSKLSLKKALLGEAATKKLSAASFRRMILKEVALLKEQPEEASEPKGTVFTDQANFKDFDDKTIDELFAQIKTRDMEQPIFSAMWKANPDATADWLEAKGEAAVRERIKTVASKIPATGLPKSEMPFLPGPPDATGEVADVVDALSPGGEINIDFKESYASGNESVIVERWSKLAGLITEVAPPSKNSLEPGSPETEDYLTSGTEANDGKVDDDNANIQMPAQVAAIDAIPTQSNILIPKALGMAVNGVEGGDLGAYFSTDNEILDGHHRWAATMLNNPAASLGGFAAIDLKAMGGTETALQHLTALGNALGNKTKNK